MKFKDRARGKSDRPSEDREGRRSGAAETFIDQGCELVGELRFSEDVRIDGKVEGRIRAAKAVIVGEAAEIRASIEAETLEIFGVVEGDIQVARGTTLHKCARVTGEIQTAGIVVEEGAKFKGCIVIGADEPATEQARPAGVAEGKPADSKQAVAKQAGTHAVA
jgi:cytoskeletal protein CcmA (bactofilin family)